MVQGGPEAEVGSRRWKGGHQPGADAGHRAKHLGDRAEKQDRPHGAGPADPGGTLAGPSSGLVSDGGSQHPSSPVHVVHAAGPPAALPLVPALPPYPRLLPTLSDPQESRKAEVRTGYPVAALAILSRDRGPRAAPAASGAPWAALSGWTEPGSGWGDWRLRGGVTFDGGRRCPYSDEQSRLFWGGGARF